MRAGEHGVIILASPSPNCLSSKCLKNSQYSKPGPQPSVLLFWPATDLIGWHLEKEEKLAETRNSGNTVQHTQEKAGTKLSIVFQMQ